MTYRYSALGAAALRMWRGWTVVVPVVLASALAQALLVAVPVQVGQAAVLVATAAGSLVVGVVSLALLTAVALQVPDGRVGWRATVARARAHWPRFVAWTLGWVAVMALGWSVYWLPGVVLLALGVFLPFAAMDDGSGTLRAAWHPIRSRPWRWLVTVGILGVIGLVGVIVSGFTMFFLRGGLGALVVGVGAGLVVAWAVTAWGLVYRATASSPSRENRSAIVPTPT